jgi:hypothetical protein
MIAAAIGAAAFSVGALFGFLFGIPRSLTSATPPLPSVTQHYQPNTNLEQISDWLTKILIGASVAGFASLFKDYKNLLHGLKRALGGDDMAHTFAGAEVIFFLITGFLCSYLLARLHLQTELELAEGLVGPMLGSVSPAPK